MDHREEKLGDSDSNESPQGEEVPIQSMQHSLQGLSLAGIRAEEQPKKSLDEGLVHHRLQAVGFKMRMLKEGEEDGVGQGEVWPAWILPLFLLLQSVKQIGLLDVWEGSENVCCHHFDKITNQRPAQGGEVLSDEVKELLEGGRLPVPVLLQALSKVEGDTAESQLLSQKLLLLLPLDILGDSIGQFRNIH